MTCDRPDGGQSILPQATVALLCALAAWHRKLPWYTIMTMEHEAEVADF